MAFLTTVHHLTPNLGDVISIHCPCCKSPHMEQDKEKHSYWTCANGHVFYVRLYPSSVKSLNLGFHQVNK